MRKRNKRVITLLLSMALVAGGIQMPTITVRAEEGNIVPTVVESMGEEGNTVPTVVESMGEEGNIVPTVTEPMDEESNALDVIQGVIEEYYDLGVVETSAIPMSFFGLSDGKVELNDGSEPKWIDRLKLEEDENVIREFYNTLVEAADNDGTDDYLIDDNYFNQQDGNLITVATVEGILDGTYSKEGAVAKLSEVYSQIFKNYAPYVRAAYEAFDRDHPEVFWLSGNTQSACSLAYSMKGTEDAYTVSYVVTIKLVLKSNDFDIRATGYETETAIKTAITEVNSKRAELVNAVSGKTVVEKITYFNDYLTKANEYNTSADLDNIGHDCRECTTALAGKIGTEGPVCEAYARAFKVLCDESGIPCVLVDGQAKNSANSQGEPHMWNYVQVNGEWLAADITWNDPRGGNSGAVSGVENTNWLLVYANTERYGMTFIESHPVGNQASSGGVGFVNGPELALYSSVTTTPGEVSTEAEFYEALADNTIDIIHLNNEITLSRSGDGKDNAFVINRPVTINGDNVGGLALERAGIVLGADVTFENMSITFNNPVRNAIVANGYSLTLNNISNSDNAAYNTDLFCGGITNYNGGNLSEIPAVGSNGAIIIKGTNDFTAKNAVAGGNIYAGSLSDVGYADGSGNVLGDIPNAYEGSASITIETGASGYGNIYAHGARENRSGGHANEWLADADLYKVSGQVSIYHNNNSNITVDGATGGEKNAMFIYQDNGKGNQCTPTLNNMDTIALLPAENGTLAHLEPTTTQTDFNTLSVPENTRLSFIEMGNEISATSLEGGGELVFAGTSQKLTLAEAAGTTKVAVGGVDYTGTESTGSISEGWTCVTVTELASEGEFSLMPYSGNPSMFLEKDEEGNWITRLEEGLVGVTVKEVTIEDKEDVEDNEGIEVPVAVTYASGDENSFIGDIPMTVTVNGQETSIDTDFMGYSYSILTDDLDLLMWFDFDYSDEDGVILYITVNGEDTYNVSKGRYEISMTIPAEYMEDQKEKEISFVLTVACNEHTGGSATSTQRAICEVCGTAYGELKGEAPNIADITIEQVPNQKTEISVNIAEKISDSVPEAITGWKLGEVQTTGSASVADTDITDGILSARISNSVVGDVITFPVTVSFTNYEETTFAVELILDNHKDDNSDGQCDSCKSKLFYVGAASKCLGNGEQIAHVSMNPSNQLASGTDKVTVTAQKLLCYTFKGWYLEGDIDESNQVLDGSTALSNSFTYTFAPNADMDLIAVYEAEEKEATIAFDNSTNFSVAIDGKEATGSQNGDVYTVSALIGSQVMVTVTDEGFINWCNDSGKIVTTQDTYTFTLTGDVNLKMSKAGVAKESAMVEFVSDYNQIIESQIYECDETITFPDGPPKMGFKFENWSLTQDEIHAKIKAGETHIKVTPVYRQDETKYAITVYVDGIVSEALSIKDVPAGSGKVVSAPEVEGKNFLYWTDEDGNILGYDISYFMKVNRDMVLKAVYGLVKVEKMPVIAMTNVYTTSENEKNMLSFSVTRDIPEGYELIEHGILYHVKQEITEPSEDTFVFGGEGVSKYVSTATKLSGVFTLSIHVTGHENVKIITRGYMIVKNAATGAEEIYYTDIANCCYNEIIN